MKEDKFLEKSQNWENPIKVRMTERFVNQIMENVNLSPDMRIVEFGCGTGLVGLQLIEKVSHLTMIDNSPSMLQHLKNKVEDSPTKNVSPLLGELNDCNENDVDLVIGFMVLHHIEDISAVFSKSFSMLKDNDSLIIGDLLKEDGSFHGDEVVAHNGFDVDELTLIAKQWNFKEITVSQYDSCPKGGKEYPLFLLKAVK